nr:heat shock protein 90-5, chloroplastic [Tanacetum cinerariifolium]
MWLCKEEGWDDMYCTAAACKNAPDGTAARRIMDLLYETSLISSGLTEEDGEELKRVKLLNQLKMQLLRPSRLKLWSHQKLEQKSARRVLDRIYDIYKNRGRVVVNGELRK